MILFKDDWVKFPTAIMDLKTSNQSFLRYSGLLKAMGVENHGFCLALIDPELQGVNPYDPDLTVEQIHRIVKECKINPWYYFREVVRVPAVAGPENRPLRANRGNISLFWLFFNHVSSMLIQPRQTGKSISTDSLMTYLFNVATLNTDVHLLTKDDGLRTKNVKRIKELLEGLPWYLQFKTKKDIDNTEKLTRERLGNTYLTSVAQASEKAALNLGRGQTIPINHVDEIAFVKNIQITLPAMLAATGAARDEAKEAGAHYGNIFTTTPGYLSSESGKFAHEIYKAFFNWSEKLFDCANEAELHTLIEKNSPKSKYIGVLLEFNHRQLGFTDDWLRGKIRDAMSDGEDAGADFLNIWAEGSETSPIPKNYLKQIKASVVNEPFIEISKYGYITRWYIPEHEVKNLHTRKVVLGLDTSDAVGNDDIALILRDVSTAEVLAVGVYNETNLVTFAEFVTDWLTKYPNLTLIIERRSSGVTIIDHLLRILPLHGIDPFRRIFNWVVNEADSNAEYLNEVINVPLSRRSVNVYIKYRKQFGYATSGSGRSSRDNLYGTAFMASVKYTSNFVRDKTLIDQVTGLVRRNDRIDHEAGGHDDLVISWLMGYWFLAEARNKVFYGLPNSIVLSGVRASMVEEEGGQDVVDKRHRQLRLKADIDVLLEELKLERNPMKATVLTNRIKHKYRDIDTSIIQAYNIETLLETINLEKRKISSNNYNLARAA